MDQQKYNNTQIKESYAYCEKIAKSHYENFPVAAFFFPADKRKNIAAIYVFARMADDIADEGDLSIEQRIIKLAELENKLQECYQHKAREPMFIALQDTINKFNIPMELFSRLLTAFKSDLIVNRYPTFHELLNYCNNAAVPIGRLILLIFEIKDNKWIEYTDNIATGLQLTDCWQDIDADLAKNRIYIPLAELNKFNLTEQDMLDKTYNADFYLLMSSLVLTTEKFFLAGEPVFLIPNKRLGFYFKLISRSGVEILRKIKKNNYDIYSKKIKLSKADTFLVLMRALFTRG